MELVLAKSQDALVLTSISKRAFDSDIEVGGTQVGGPPGYQSHKYHIKMAAQKHLYTFYNNGLIVGGAILFKDGTNLYIGRIFIAPEHFHALLHRMFMIVDHCAEIPRHGMGKNRKLFFFQRFIDG